MAEFAACVSDKLTMRENVDSLLTPRMLGFAQQLTAAQCGGEVLGEGVELAMQGCSRLAAGAYTRPLFSST